jgi:phosphoadenosine phosphosulfate reductase
MVGEFMQDVYRNGAFEPDPWHVVGDDQPIHGGGYVIVPKTRLLAADIADLPVGVPLGVLIAAGDTLADLVPILPKLALVAVNFPKFNDGRGFSIARLLRERYDYTGPLRAVGDVLIDLMPHMERVGFTEFTVTNDPTRKVLAAKPLPEMLLFYQPAWSGDTHEAPIPSGRPWLRRAI